MRQLAGALLMAGMTATGAAAAPFATRADAQAYISGTLTKAIAQNPKYLTKADGTVTEWVSDEVAFATGADGAVRVTLREHFIQTRGDKTVKAPHEARFSMADVTVSDYVEPGDVTPSGETAIGVSFVCKAKGCVAAIWGDTPSQADGTDFYVQDVATRDKLRAAFLRLQAP